MSHYLIHQIDSFPSHDDDGVELSNDDQARADAVALIGTSLAFRPGVLPGDGEFQVQVTGEDEVLLITVMTLAFRPAAPRRSGDST